MLGVVLVSAAAAALRLEVISSAGVLVGTLIAFWVVRSRAYQRIEVTRLEAWAVPVIFLGAIAARAAFGLLTLSRTGPGLAFAYASDDDAYFKLASALAADPAELGYVLAASAFPPG
ncbi:MAG TPA: hypothetical protein VMO26_10750 [Vicinamibacterales bacterium]|nr:hypothetical protein [Vicinamibacterales bacterium]